MTGHTSVATVIGYFRRADMQRSRAADLMGLGEADEADETAETAETDESLESAHAPARDGA